MLKNSCFVIVCCLLLLGAAQTSTAANRFWIASTSSNWNNTANWSTTSGGTGGASVPLFGGDVIFDGNGQGDCSIDVNINITSINIGSGYSGTVSQGSSTVQISNFGFNISSGSFLGGAANITIFTGLFISGTGSFTSTTATLLLGASDYSLSGGGTFFHNDGKVRFQGTTQSIVGSTTFSDLEFAVGGASATYNISASTVLTVTRTLLHDGNTQRIAFNTGTIEVEDNFTVNSTNIDTSGGGTATILINGVGNQVLSGTSIIGAGKLPNVTIDKPSGTLTLLGITSLGTNATWTYNQGTLDASSNNSTLVFTRSNTIDGTHSLHNLHFIRETFEITAGTDLTANGDIELAGTNRLRFNTGTINAKGDIIITNTNADTSNGGTATIFINGTGNQNLTGSGVPGTGKLPNVTIDKPSGILTLTGEITMGSFSKWEYVQGTIDAISNNSNLILTRTNTIEGTHSLHNLEFRPIGSVGFTIALGTELTTTGVLKTSGDPITSPMAINGGVINAHGNVLVTNEGPGATGGTATVKINGSGNQTITGNGIIGFGKLPNILIDKSSGTLSLNDIISVGGNWEYVQGSVSTTGSTVVFTSTFVVSPFTVDGQGLSSSMAFNDIIFKSSSSKTILGGLLNVNGDLLINDGLTELETGANSIFLVGNWTNNGTFTAGTGAVTFIGGAKTISGTSATTFNNLTINTSGDVSLSAPVNVTGGLAMNTGNINTNAVNILTFKDNANVFGASNASFVVGPVAKEGDDGFIFPVGRGGFLASIGMSAPANVTDVFSAEYQDIEQPFGNNKENSIGGITNCQFWFFDRLVGTSDVNVTLTWNSNNCGIFGTLAGLDVIGWDGGQWVNHGNGGTNGNINFGTVVSSGPISIFGPVTIGLEGLPTTQLQASNCISSNLALNDVLTADPVLDAMFYQFLIEDEATDYDFLLTSGDENLHLGTVTK